MNEPGHGVETPLQETLADLTKWLPQEVFWDLSLTFWNESFQSFRRCVLVLKKTKIYVMCFLRLLRLPGHKKLVYVMESGKNFGFCKKHPKNNPSNPFLWPKWRTDVRLLDSWIIVLEELWPEKRSPTYKESAPKSKSWYHWCTMLGFTNRLGSLDARTKNNGDSWRCNTQLDIDLYQQKWWKLRKYKKGIVVFRYSTHAIHGAGIFYPKDKLFI